MRLTPSELAQLAYDETGWRDKDLVIAVAIALGESGGDPAIKSKVDKPTKVWGVSTGLWQIRPLNADKGKGGPRDETRLHDPAYNARSAYQIFTFAGGRFTPWGAFNNGSYKRHLPVAQAAVDGLKEQPPMAWRLVASLRKLMGEVDAMAPHRSRASDGTIGDSAHSSRRSDHNPEPDGTVDACDITHDPAHGADMNVITARIVARRDRRLKYIIWNKHICSGYGGPSPWQWRWYGDWSTGKNPHDKHAHFSAHDEFQDDTSSWFEEDWFDMATKEELKDAIREVLDEEPSKRKPKGTRYLVKLIHNMLSYNAGGQTYPDFSSRIDRIESHLGSDVPATPEP